MSPKKLARFQQDNDGLFRFSQYYRLASIPVHQVVEAMRNGQEFFRLVDSAQPTLMVAISCQRMLTYTKGVNCVHCGREGHFFGVERQIGSGAFHLNLYHIQRNGSYMLMTSDHIIAKANGGSNLLENRQTMCTICNGTKSDYATMEDAIAAKRVRTSKQTSYEATLIKIRKAQTSIDHALAQINLSNTDAPWTHILSTQRYHLVKQQAHLKLSYGSLITQGEYNE